MTGIGNHLISLADALRARGHRVEIIGSDSFSSFGRWGRLSRVAFPVALAARIRELAKRGAHFDVVNAHEPSGLWCAMWKKWDTSFPRLVVTSHGVEQRAWDSEVAAGRPGWKSRVVYPVTQLAQSNFALRHADRVAVLSSEDAEFVRRRLGVMPDRIHLVSNGVDAGLFELIWEPSSRPRLLYVGSWIRRKGTEFLPRLFSLLRQEYPWLELWAVGTGVSQQNVVRAFAAADRPFLTVLPSLTRQDLRTVLSHDQIFVLPSEFEGMPLSLLEAMAGGLPCVVSDTCGMRDIIRHGTNGFRLPIGQLDQWTHNTRLLLDSAELRKRVGTESRQEARKRTWDRVAGDWEQVFLAAAQSTSASGREYDQWHSQVAARDDLERDLASPWHRFAQSAAGKVDGLRVLDAACGRGQLSLWLARKGASVASVDFSFGAVALAHRRLQQELPGAAALCADVQALPFAASSFDLVISCETLEHVPKPRDCVREFFRILRKGGILILTTENYLNLWGLYRLYCQLRKGQYNSGEVAQPIENWMFSPLTKSWISRAGFILKQNDGEQHHLYLLPKTNPAETEAKILSRNPLLRRLLKDFGRRHYLVAEKPG
jgi:glycosyltransferase involved in cell wall biosynthesis/ubiquinone/menaquinone biosynthesis C-methylase UbiE